MGARINYQTDLDKKYKQELEQEDEARYLELVRARFAREGGAEGSIPTESIDPASLEKPSGYTDINAVALDAEPTRADTGGAETRGRKKGETPEEYDSYLLEDLLASPSKGVMPGFENKDSLGNLVPDNAVGGLRFTPHETSPERNALDLLKVPDDVEAREAYVEDIPKTNVGTPRNITMEADAVQALQKRSNQVKDVFDKTMQEWGYTGAIENPTVRNNLNNFLKSTPNIKAETMQEFIHGDLAGAARAYNNDSPLEASLVMTMGVIYDLAQREKTASRDMLALDEYPGEDGVHKMTHAQMRGIRAVERDAWHDQHDAEGSSMGATIARGLGMETDGNGNTMLGGIAEVIVPEALGNSAADGDAIFTTKRLLKTDNTFKDVLSLTQAGMEFVDNNLNLFNHVLKIPDKLPRVGEEGRRTQMPNKADLRLKGKIDGRSFVDRNAEKKFIKALFLMDDTAYKMQETGMDGLSLMMGADYATQTNIPNAVSDLFDGPAYKKIKQGGELGARNKSYIVIHEDGSKETMPNHSDDWKDEIALRNIMFSKQTMGQELRFDHFHGSNWRTYVDSKLNNYQAEHLARANLGFAVALPYHLNSKKEMLFLKSAIMKKTGMGPAGLEIKYEGMKLEAGQKAYDNIIKEWEARFGALVESFELYNAFGKLGNKIVDGGMTAKEAQLREKNRFKNPKDPMAMAARELVEYAAGYDGYHTINAIIEGVKLKKALDNKNSKVYATNFMVEADGIANGLSINALFSAMDEVAKRTGVTKSLIKGYLDDNNLLTDLDVYQFHAQLVFKSLVKNTGPGDASTAELAEVLEKLGILGRKGSKKPIMISSYSAGIDLVKDKVYEALMEARSNIPDFDQQLREIGWDIIGVTNILGQTYWSQIVAVLGEVKHYGQLMGNFMSNMLKQRLENPDLPDPSLILPDGNILHYGLMVPTVEGPIIEFMGRELRRTTMRLDPMAEEVSKRTGKFVGYPKAQVSVSPVTTHAMDSNHNVNVVIRSAEESPAKRYGVDGAITAQIFDGFLFPPMFMEYMNRVLNEEFIKLGDRKSNLESLVDTARDAGYDVERGIDGEMSKLVPKMMTMASNARAMMKVYKTVNQFPIMGGLETHVEITGPGADDYKRVFKQPSMAEGVLTNSERYLGNDKWFEYGEYTNQSETNEARSPVSDYTKQVRGLADDYESKAWKGPMSRLSEHEMFLRDNPAIARGTATEAVNKEYQRLLDTDRDLYPGAGMGSGAVAAAKPKTTNNTERVEKFKKDNYKFEVGDRAYHEGLDVVGSVDGIMESVNKEKQYVFKYQSQGPRGITTYTSVSLESELKGASEVSLDSKPEVAGDNYDN